jgi:hypothetical protein
MAAKMLLKSICECNLLTLTVSCIELGPILILENITTV